MNLTSVSSPYAGKKLTQPHLNLLAKLAAYGASMSESRETRANPFTKVSHELDPLAVALYDFITGTVNSMTNGLSFRGHKVKVGEWDRARYLFLHLWPDQYYDLLD